MDSLHLSLQIMSVRFDRWYRALKAAGLAALLDQR